MKHTVIISAIALVAGSSMALAQESNAFYGQNAASDAVNDLSKAINETNERTLLGSGNSGRKMGWTGSVSALATATSGNTENSDLGIGARLGYFDGTNGHMFNLSSSYGEKEGVTNKNDTSVSYDYTRELGSNLYGYGQVNAAYSEFGSYEEDYFVGAGLGYHVISNGQTQWSVQTGPGYRKATANNASSKDIKEGAWSLSSQLTYEISDAATLYNDTDILYSESDTFTTNELGVSVALSNALALRTSLTTEYHSKPLPNFESTDNKLGMSIVYNFD